ncbi:MAG: ATPase domain-containing protein [Bacteroidales bacterium]|nr:ATPase domain-containing protein [Bacteroidales bacterium]
MSQFKYNLESALGELRSWAPSVNNRIECIYKENNKSRRVYGSLEEMLELAKTKKEANLFFVPQECEYPENRFITQKDVKRWKNLIIDLDPVRPAGKVSLQEELDAACTVAHKIYDQVINPYFSGNGYHVWAPIDLEVNQESIAVVSDFLETIKQIYQTDRVEVDTCFKNPAQLTTLYGTVKKKSLYRNVLPGTTLEHRQSRIEKSAFRNQETSLEELKEINNEIKSKFMVEEKNLVEVEKTQRQKNVEWFKQFASEYNIAVKNYKEDDNGVYANLEKCPFCENDDSTGHAVKMWDNGDYTKFYYICQHQNHCQVNGGETKHWWKEYYKQITGTDLQTGEVVKEKEENSQKEENSLIFSYNEVQAVPREYVSTGYQQLDHWLGGGFQRSGYTLLAGKTGEGKSTFAYNFINNIPSDKKILLALSEGSCEQIKGDMLKVIKGERENISLTQKLDLLTFEEQILDKYDVIFFDNLNSYKWEEQVKVSARLNTILPSHRASVVLLTHTQNGANFTYSDTISGSVDVRRYATQILCLQKSEGWREKAKGIYGEKRERTFANYLEEHQDVNTILSIEKTRGEGVNTFSMFNYANDIITERVRE